MKYSVTSLAFDKIPHQPAVFLKYVGLAQGALSFYRHPPTLEALIRAVDEVRSGAFPRQEIVEILRRQNESFGASDPVRRAIADLAKPDSVAVVTGQQIGLFTGPILTIYKALTALRMSEELRRRGFNAVPIFWLASDDHDLAEITRLTIPGPGSEIRVLDSRELLFGTTEMPPRPVGTIELPETIRQVIDAYGSSFLGEWSDKVRSRLISACQPGANFAGAFGRLMAGLFRDKGLILFDPRDAGAKMLAAPVIRKALGEAQLLRTQLAERSRRLQDFGLEAQVAILPHSTMVFFEEEGERRLLAARDGEFVLKDTSRRFRLEELLHLTESAPERFSANVLLRPLVQDNLLPTVAYVAGPAEISYFAQIEPLYRFYGRPMPVVWPRASFTILAGEARATMERHALRLEDLFLGERHLVREILKAQPERSEILLAELTECADRGIEQLKPAVASADPSLGPAAETVRRKLLHRISSLQAKFVSFEMRRNSALRAEVLHVLNQCYPNGNLQERELGVHYLLALLGPQLVDTLYNLVDLGSFTHQVVHL
jgi:bacillithiol biosynthesis cysteine-adding enzyme BshC